MSKKKMTARKLAANRANARKSTGPRTAEGKARVSQNAITHGMLAQNLVIIDEYAESMDEMNAILEGLQRDIAPTSLLEQFLIERIAACYWRLRRSYRFETNSIIEHRENCSNAIAQLTRSIEGKTSPPLTPEMPNDANFDKLIRYEGMIDRTLHRLTLQLARLRNAGDAQATADSDTEPLLTIPDVSPDPQTPEQKCPDKTNPNTPPRKPCNKQGKPGAADITAP